MLVVQGVRTLNWLKNGKITKVSHKIFGASLSEPHTSVTAFAEVVFTYVCMYVCIYVCLRPYTVNFK